MKTRLRDNLKSSWARAARFVAILILVASTASYLPVFAASTRLEERSVTMRSARSGEITDYVLSWRYMSEQAVGSVDLQFCTSPIPYLPCYPPVGMDVSSAELGEQTGETGFSITEQTENHIVLSRAPSVIDPGEKSSYQLKGIRNPTNVEAFAIRIQMYSEPDLGGERGDFGGVRSSVSHDITIETQVPPILIFCLSRQVELECTGSDDIYSTQLGELSHENTLMAQSQMAVGTNATAGFAITLDGVPLAAGTRVIDAMTTPATSQPGKNQFGINLVANTEPEVGEDPQGVWMNAEPTADYGVPNRFKFVAGDVVATSPNVSLMRKFTVSYIVNSKENLHPGIYATTITFIASGRF